VSEDALQHQSGGSIGDDPVGASSLTTSPAPLGRWRSRGVWLLIVAGLAWAMLSLVFIPAQPGLDLLSMAIGILLVLSFGLVGALVATRRPRNPVGWILWATAITMSVVVGGQDYAAYSYAAFDGGLPGTLALAWLSSIGFMPAFAVVIVLVPLLFPDGRLLSSRWRWVAWFGILAIVTGPASIAFQPGLLDNFNGQNGSVAIANPMGIEALGGLKDVLGIANILGILIAFPLAIASSIVRYRRGSPTERAQLRWFGSAVIFTVIWLVPAIPGMPVIPLLSDVGWLLAVVSFALIPVAIGIAVLRYRLYEIDLIINRTLVYVLLTAMVAGLYSATVALMERIMTGAGESSDVAIVITTLVVVVVFTPVKNAVQATVDRRFKVASKTHAQPPIAADGPTELLGKLAALREKGILTDDEFAAKKGDILARL
jgi:hypothetical protein